jgi:short-subunit dehydrogenase
MSAPRTVLITGASEGIGRASVRAFAARGDRIVAVARNEERLRTLETEVPDASQLSFHVADVADAASMTAMAEAVLADGGAPDVVLANAGVGLDALFVETTDEALQRVLEINVVGLVRTVRPFVPGMLERGRGRILLVSSIVGKRGIPHYAAYSASKFALHGIADALRAELYGTGVSVGVVCPASTSTDFQKHADRIGPAQHRVRPRRHTPESVAHAIVRMAGSTRREMILGMEAKLMTFVDAIAPGIIDRVLARMLTRRK